jgi:hypothetical protein
LRLGRGAGALLVWLALAGPAASADWGGIQPGLSTRQNVETLYGRPSWERTVVEEKRNLLEWTYAGERAPRGVTRMVVSFGLNGASGFRDELVRALQIYPAPGAYTIGNITAAWGKPEAIGTNQETGQVMFRYNAQGLLVVMNRRGDSVEVMLFVPTPTAEKR